jgi:quercetin dioxygenase-like cupin family protein
MNLNAQFEQPAVVHAGAMPWVGSPSPGVERRMLERVGAEVARATSIVRYASGSRFAPHVHRGGEEFLVLDGVFQDEVGDYPAGSYVRNPPRSAHEPRSDSGCTIFVKLWQFDPDDQVVLRVNTAERAFGHRLPSSLRQIMPLFDNQREAVCLQQWPAGIEESVLAPPGGIELLVVDGSFRAHLDLSRHDTAAGFGTEFNTEFVAQSWCRLPAGTKLTLASGARGCRLWVKTGHLQHVEPELARLAAFESNRAASRPILRSDQP